LHKNKEIGTVSGAAKRGFENLENTGRLDRAAGTEHRNS
jgi:hypothetical protein